MAGKLQNKVYRFVLALLLIAGVYSVPASANLKSGAWQELSTSTGAVNGTIPQADGAQVPVYQGSIVLKTDQSNPVAFTAMPRDFSVDADSRAMLAVNELDTEGDLFTNTPLRWENQQVPAVGLVWADAAAPDEPLNPQPVQNKSFCAQNMAGRHFVVWPEIESSDDSPAPVLYLWTATGEPNINTVPLLKQKIAIDVAPAVGTPVTVSADRFDDALKAAKAKVGESITLSVTTQGCDGEVVGNAPFVIRRDDAINRKGAVNNDRPVHVGDTELTTTKTLYRGVTDAQGNATVVVTQANGPGVKTHLVVSSENYPDLTAETDVIFTTLTSPDSEQAAMYGHMPESVTAELNGVTYKFTRPKLAEEASDRNGSIVSANETWAQFNWAAADNHCTILPDAEQLVAMRNAHDTAATYPGWPLPQESHAQYWSSTKDLYDYHAAVHMDSGQVARESDSSEFLVSCVDKALPPAHPQITLSPEAPYKAKVGETIDLVMTVVDRDTQKPLPYRYMELLLDPATNRKGAHNAEWDNQRVVIHSEDMRASSPEHYTGVTDANGQVHLTLQHDNGVGVETPIRIVMPDDEGGNVTYPFSVIFTVITSPDVDGANMYGHMQGIVDAGNLYKRPLLVSETGGHASGQQSENNEDWATFNSEASAAAMCGTGQVPGTSTLTHLYGENPDNKMETEHGWPTGLHAYIAAESQNEQTAHVSLKDGGKGFSNEPNYLTCSANEMVAVLDVYFSDDVTVKDAVAKVGEKIKMNVHSTNALNGEAIPHTDFTITLSAGRRRDGLSTGFTDPSNGELLIDGVAYGAGQGAMVYHGQTDAQGDAEIIIEQPRGPGVVTPLEVAPTESLIRSPVSRSVKFTVATSPDTPDANMWGHMPDTITVGDMTFTRPKLAAEVSATRSQLENNETWARVQHSDAAGNENKGGCAVNRLPRLDQIQALYDANSGGTMHGVQGWPVVRPYWSSSLASATTWKALTLDSGAQSVGGSSDSDYTSCLTADNPVATSITIEPVDASLWYDGDGEHAVKVKKGDTLKLKVTVKDANGNPLPSAPFVLNRGDGYTRQGEKHSSQPLNGGNADPIVSPVVIDGEALNDTQSRIGKMTGEDGTVILDVTRPDTHGTRVAVTAALYNNANVSASIDTIFTVVTSPDVKVAQMWGHMPETVRASDGTVYHRPLLQAEVGSTANSYNWLEDNESWATFYGPDSSKPNPANCAIGYYPSAGGLDALYNTYPNRTIKTEKGWPIDRSYWSGTYSYSVKYSTAKPSSFYVVDLDDGARRTQSTNDANGTQYQICAATPMAQATRIELFSSLPEDSAAQAIKVKDSESIPFVIRTTDAAGNPLGNTPVVLVRDVGVARNASYTGWAKDFNLAFDSYSDTDFAANYNYYAVTGDDGTLAFNLVGNQSPGVKNVLTASLYTAPTTSAAKPVVFTVQTTPDSGKANMWGHMPETVTTSAGITFHRPLLYSEMSGGTSGSFKADNETWPLVSKTSAQKTGVTGCDEAYQPLLNDLQTLYNDHPGGELETLYGWPVTQGKYWWALDRVVKTQDYQFMRLDNGAKTSNSSAGTTGAQVCLVDPHAALPATIELTSSLSATVSDAVKVKTGEAIPMTVTIKDASGMPVANAPFTLSRSKGINRAGVVKETGNGGTTDDLTLQELTPTATTIELPRYVDIYHGVTGADGSATFSLRQDTGMGLKTAITAKMDDYPNLSASLNVIFTVVTSPDTDKAQYWGHMPETVTSSDGVVFKRPQMMVEAPAESNTFGSRVYGNEIWALFNHDGVGLASESGCPDAYQPTLSEMQRLYKDYPDGQLGERFGWPVDRSEFSWWVSDKAGAYYQVIYLMTGAVYSTKTLRDNQALVCLANPH
ncbi:adhesion domain-containing protein [Superficieibacter sp. 1612_C1]|uniref:adhesion domain-containing protein n=1 Tax=Superficieibacter sp. 1612_C1 TaxID=2780382 RepID=UPI001883EACC|nr:DUF823 domain-containing adhesin [Superficieibacter sp. 1612_C1]